MYVPSNVKEFAVFVTELPSSVNGKPRVSTRDMLLACLRNMSKQDIKDMLISEGYTSEKEMEILRVDINAREKAFVF